MFILQRWEPIISDSFPSLISFWIKIQGIPLHGETPRNLIAIGKVLGEYLDQDTDEGRVRVHINALKPLITQQSIQFPSDEEVHIEMQYEKLEKHCFCCHSLSHEEKNCPLASSSSEKQSRKPRTEQVNLNQLATRQKLELYRKRNEDHRSRDTITTRQHLSPRTGDGSTKRKEPYTGRQPQKEEYRRKESYYEEYQGKAHKWDDTRWDSFRKDSRREADNMYTKQKPFSRPDHSYSKIRTNHLPRNEDRYQQIHSHDCRPLPHRAITGVDPIMPQHCSYDLRKSSIDKENKVREETRESYRSVGNSKWIAKGTRPYPITRGDPHGSNDREHRMEHQSDLNPLSQEKETSNRNPRELADSSSNSKQRRLALERIENPHYTPVEQTGAKLDEEADLNLSTELEPKVMDQDIWNHTGERRCWAPMRQKIHQKLPSSTRLRSQNINSRLLLDWVQGSNLNGSSQLLIRRTKRKYHKVKDKNRDMAEDPRLA